MRPLATILLALTTSCNWISDPGGDGYRQDLLRELDRRQVQWDTLEVHDYDFDYDLNCFCAPEAVQAVTIEVRNDQIVRVVNELGEEVLPQAGLTWPTVDSLFVWTRRYVNNRAYTVEVGFDLDFGFPNHLAGDVPRSVDDEFLHTAANLIVRTVP